MIRLSMPLAVDAATPGYIHPVLVDLLPTLDLIDDLRGGPVHMWTHALDRGYIPKWTDESEATYKYRSRSEPVFMGLDRTITAGASMLWSREPRITWGAQETTFKPLWDNLDAAGSKGSVFGKRITERVIEHGIAAILTDHTSAPRDQQVTAASERALNLRPFVRMYSRRNIVNWRTRLVNNVPTLTQITFREYGEIDNSRFGIETMEHYRVVFINENGLAAWELYEHRDKTSYGIEGYHLTAKGIFRNRNAQPRTTLPVALAAIGGDDVNVTLDAYIPLRGVAFANLGHWRAATNLTFNREVAGFEMLVIQGDLRRSENDEAGKPAKMKIGPLCAVHVEQGGSVSWIGPSGSGNAQLELACKEKMEAMDRQGLGFLIPHVSGSPTATEVRVKSHAQLSTLADVGVAIADAFNLMFEHVAWYLGMTPPDAPTLSLQTDFADTSMAPDVMRVYRELVDAGFPKRVVLKAMQEGGRIGPDEDLDVLEAEWDGESEAMRMVREEEARARAEQMTGARVPASDGETDDDTDDGDDDGGAA